MQAIKEDTPQGFNLIFECPHCKEYIIVSNNEINCSIFRHGIYKKTFYQVNPHSPKNICDELKKADVIYGCGKPFKLSKIDDNYFADICDYI
jgi:hypothetical protein